VKEVIKEEWCEVNFVCVFTHMLVGYRCMKACTAIDQCVSRAQFVIKHRVKADSSFPWFRPHVLLGSKIHIISKIFSALLSLS
jgi:hypothetical protein